MKQTGSLTLHHNLNFRLATSEDLEAIEQIWINGLQQINSSFIVDGSFLDLFRQNFKNRQGHFNFWVAEDSLVIGWCSILPAFSHPFKHHSNGEVSIYIDEKFNSNGVGTGLMNFVFDQLKNSPIECVFGFANHLNTRSIRMCKNAGMRVCGKMNLKTILIKEF